MTTALYRRYRPDTFDQVIGQAHVTDPLKAALRANRVTHAYLFSGPRGCGKTTSARILARCLNCAQGPTDTPCGQCDSCKELATGGSGSLDVVEIDAASHGGVDDARDLRERATFAPVRDRYKIFIIDEAHMVTNQGFNALLKLVEEPPEHVKFVFATTEPERVIGTIRSRTHHYPFRLVPPDVLEPYLHGLCDEESVDVGDGVLGLVMRAGTGSVRDTLSVLDQLMAGSVDGRVDYQTAVSLLGYTDNALLDQSVDALAGGDGAAAYRVVERMVESGHDPRRFVEDLLQRLRDLLIIAVAGDGASEVLAGTPVDQFERMQHQARNWGPRGLSRAADLTDEALRAMTGATSPRLQLELLIGRILVPADVAAPAQAGGPAVQNAPMPGAVGMSGGGAPEEGRFGAREAREALKRRRESQNSTQAPTRPQEGTSSAASASAGAPSQPATPPAGDTVGQRPEQPVAPRQETSVPSADAAAPTNQGWPEASIPGRAASQPDTASSPSTDQQPAVDTAQAPVAPPAPPEVASQDTSAPPAQAQGSEQPQTVSAAAVSGREADMIRGRWNEIVERLSSISRVTWSLVGGNAQLGAVDGTQVVLLFPVDHMAANFVRGNRGADVEKAIQETTGLVVQVSAQVGQASGGSAVTAPSAPASQPQAAASSAPQPEPAAAPSAPAQHPDPTQGWVSEPPPFEQSEYSPRPEPAPEYERDNQGEASDSPQEIEDTSLGVEPEAVGGQEEPKAPQGEDVRPSEPVIHRSGFSVFTYPGDDDNHDSQSQSDNTAEVATQQHASAVAEPAAPRPPAVEFDDEPEDDDTDVPAYQSDDPTESDATASSELNASTNLSGWDVPVAVPGGQNSVTFQSDHSDWFQPEPVTEPSAVPEVPRPSGRLAAIQALREQQQDHARDNAAPRSSVLDDDTASIDDEDIENSAFFGLPAVLEILGGKVIEEKFDEGNR
ncbi:DNA polymerase III subunit gamma and tau [Schaalia vaccimaxillae]|uniref:DNA polymerase III subunit gamma and tau n=1 Tax=Schaalia vaccimaxillae TaxID=183916 RepID=UPI0003B57E5C|nr:DNA polymerase III subunit gamma and tau [Schaalia vaccimaxillae]